MNPEPPCEADWEFVAYFPNVYFKKVRNLAWISLTTQGNSLRDRDWKACQVSTALAVVVIIPNSGNLDPNIVDGSTVLVTNHVESLSSCQILASFGMF